MWRKILQWFMSSSLWVWDPENGNLCKRKFEFCCYWQTVQRVKRPNFSELQLKYRATLSILRGAYLQFQNKYKESFECYREALRLYPFRDTVSAVSILIDNSYIKPSIRQLNRPHYYWSSLILIFLIFVVIMSLLKD